MDLLVAVIDLWQRGHGALNTWLKGFIMILLVVGVKNRKRPARRQAFGDGFGVGSFPLNTGTGGRGWCAVKLLVLGRCLVAVVLVCWADLKRG